MFTRTISRIKLGLTVMLLSAALQAGALSTGANADFDKGMAAIEAGDYQAAMAEWRPLAEAGVAEAQFNLGLMYDNGYGVPQDDAEAAAWYRRAAEQGDASAQNNLGVMYRKGEGVPQDYAEAAAWYRRAAEQGDASAQNNLGVMYEDGHGMPQDYVMAHMWYNLAGSGGNDLAQKNRDVIASKMSPHAVSKAQALARQCLASHYQDCGD